MTDYQSSSHLSSWLFTTEQLVKLRKRANNDARTFLLHKQHMQQQHEAQLAQQAAGGDAAASTTPTPSTGDIPTILAPQCFAMNYQIDRVNPDLPSPDQVTQLLQDDAHTSQTDPNNPNSAQPPSLSSANLNNRFLTPLEEQSLLEFYSSKLFSLIGPNAQIPELQRDVKVASTAALLYTRFYLSNSVMMYDPKAIMVASAFLAAKVEDLMVDIRYLENGTKQMEAHVTQHEIIHNEIALLRGIDSYLLVFHPYKTVLAYTEDLRTFLKSEQGRPYVQILDNTNRNSNPDDATAGGEGAAAAAAEVDPKRAILRGKDLQPIHEEARRIVHEAVMSDLPLVATPGMIGLGAMMVANEKLIAKYEAATSSSTDGANNGGTGSSAGAGDEPHMRMPKIDFWGYMNCRFRDGKQKSMMTNPGWKNQMLDLCSTLKKLDEDKGKDPDFVTLKAIHKKLKGCKVWGGGKKKKKKKRKREE